MPPANLSIIKLAEEFVYHLQLPDGQSGPRGLLATLQFAPAAEATLHHEIESLAQLLNQSVILRSATSPARLRSGADPLVGLGRLLYNQLLPGAIQEALAALPPGAALVLTTNYAALPWELLHDGTDFLALQRTVSRQLLLGDLPRPPMRKEQPWRALLVGDPTGDLPHAGQEIEQIITMLEGAPAAQVATARLRHHASKATILQHLASGDFDLIHFAGHAVFDPQHPQASGLVLAHGAILTAGEIEQNLGGAPLVFLNSCDSARSEPTLLGDQLSYWGAAAHDLAAAFVRAGAQTVIGAYWPVHDTDSCAFALSCYRHLLHDAPIAEAVHLARRQARQAQPELPHWAAYVIYGGHETLPVRAMRNERALVTVLAARLLPVATRLQEAHAEATAEQMRLALAQMAEQVVHFGGRVQSLASTMLLAVFGIPTTQSNDAERGVRAALQMRALIARLPPLPGGRSLRLAIGLSSGELLVGAIGDASQTLTTLLGDPVEQAVNLAAAASENEIVVSEAVRRLSPYQFDFATFTSYTHAAAGQLVAHLVTASVAETVADWQRPDYQLPLVGRQRELAWLHEQWQICQHGPGQIIHLVGEAGVGKSRLLFELHRQLANAPLRWRLISCPTTYTPAPYATIVQLLRSVFGLAPTDDEADARAKIRQGLRALHFKMADALSLVGEVLGLAFPDASAPLRDEPVRQRRLTALLGQLLMHYAAQTPHLIVIDNIHLADEASISVLNRLLTGGEFTAMLFVMLQRAEAGWEAPWNAHPHYHKRTLSPLAQDESRALLTTLLASSGSSSERMDQAVIDGLLPLAKGNPLFLRELVAVLQEKQTLQFRAGHWRLTRTPQGADAPATIQRLLRARIETLSRPAQRAAAVLAVAGDEGDGLLLRAALPAAETLLDTGLSELVEKGLVIRTWHDDSHRFSHALIQAAIYQRLPGAERRHLHRRIGDLLEQRWDRRNEHRLSLLAHHYYHAVSEPAPSGAYAPQAAGVAETALSQALDYLGQAGDQANARFAARQAITHFQRMSALLADESAGRTIWLARAHEGLGDAYNLLGEFAAATNAYHAALAAVTALARTPETNRRAADLARRIGRLYGWQQAFEQAHASMQRGLALLGEPQTQADQATAALIYTHTGSLFYLQNQFQRAEEACLTALQLVGDWEAGPVTATTCNVLGVLAVVTGRWAQGIAYYERSRLLWEAQGDHHHAAEVTDNLSTLYYYQGEFAQAEQFYQRNLAFWRSSEAEDKAGYTLLNLGSIYLARRQFEQARQAFEEALRNFVKSGNRQLLPNCQTNLGFLELGCKNYALAEHYFRESIAANAYAENLRGLSEAELALGRSAVALNHAHESLAMAEAADAVLEQAMTLRIVGKIHLTRGELDKAQTTLAQSQTLLEHLGARYELALTLVQLAHLARATGDHERANALFTAAAHLFAECGAPNPNEAPPATHDNG